MRPIVLPALPLARLPVGHPPAPVPQVAAVPAVVDVIVGVPVELLVPCPICAESARAGAEKEEIRRLRKEAEDAQARIAGLEGQVREFEAGEEAFRAELGDFSARVKVLEARLRETD